MSKNEDVLFFKKQIIKTLFMNKQAKILSQQFYTLKKTPQTRSSVKLRQTGETFMEADRRSETTWNIFSQHHNMMQSSMKKECYLLTAADCQRIVNQNQALKGEVKRLNDLLESKRNRELRSLQSIKTETSVEEQNEEEKKHLKKVVEKSYFSMREMQKLIDTLKNSLTEAEEKIHVLQHKCRLMELDNNSLKNSLSDTKSIHREQISFCTDRIKKLQSHIEQLVRLMQEDQFQWRKHQDELNKLKKFYFTRTYH